MQFEHDPDDDPSAATAEALQQIAIELGRIADSGESERRIGREQGLQMVADPYIQRERARKEQPLFNHETGDYLGVGVRYSEVDGE